MSQFFNDHEIQSPGSKLINCGPEKIWRKKNYELLRKCFFREKDSSTRPTSTNSENYNFYMFALLEIARIYKALKLFADLQGPICYNDAQNKGMNFIVY